MQISNNLLEPIITVFVANGERYNLLNSVVLEMFDFIRREGIKSLTAYFVDKLYSQVEEVDYDATFLKLKDRYEQSKDYVSTQSAAASSQLQSSRIRRDERALDRGQPSSPQKVYQSGNTAWQMHVTQGNQEMMIEKPLFATQVI